MTSSHRERDTRRDLISFSVTGSSSCKQCPTGFFCNDTGLSAPIPCRAGYFCPGGPFNITVCPTGSYCPAGVSAAVQCKMCSNNGIASGSGCPEGSTSDSKLCQCPPGYIGDGLNDGFGCSPCPAETFQNGLQQFCTSCPSGATSSPGSTNISM